MASPRSEGPGPPGHVPRPWKGRDPRTAQEQWHTCLLTKQGFSPIIVAIMLEKGERPFPKAIDARRAGVYLIKLIRRQEHIEGRGFISREDVPVLVLTAVSDLSLRDDLEGLGVRFISKPFLMKGALDCLASTI